MTIIAPIVHASRGRLKKPSPRSRRDTIATLTPLSIEIVRLFPPSVSRVMGRAAPHRRGWSRLANAANEIVRRMATPRPRVCEFLSEIASRCHRPRRRRRTIQYSPACAIRATPSTPSLPGLTRQSIAPRISPCKNDDPAGTSRDPCACTSLPPAPPPSPQRDPPRQHTGRYPPPSGVHPFHHRQRPRRRR
jgi:hypothetical protein